VPSSTFYSIFTAVYYAKKTQLKHNHNLLYLKHDSFSDNGCTEKTECAQMRIQACSFKHLTGQRMSDRRCIAKSQLYELFTCFLNKKNAREGPHIFTGQGLIWFKPGRKRTSRSLRLTLWSAHNWSPVIWFLTSAETCSSRDCHAWNRLCSLTFGRNKYVVKPWKQRKNPAMISWATISSN